MVRFFVWLLVCCILFFSYPSIGQSKESEPVVSAENSVLIEQETGRVLFEKDAHKQNEIASITKIMTAIIALEYGDLEDTVKVSRNAVFTPGSSIYLELNEEMTLRDLLYGLMLRSGNDAAVAIAEHIGGSEEGFTYLMNETAAYLGMTNTHFMNSHGLDDPHHYSTAYDMALLMQHAMNNETFQKISNEELYTSKNRTYAWKNKNKLLTSLYEPCTGGKTGYTRQAGRTLVSTAEKEELSLILVTLNAPDDWNDHIQLYDWGFDNFTLKKVIGAGKKEYLLNGEIVTGYINDDVIFPIKNNELSSMEKQVTLFAEPTKRDKLGTVKLKNSEDTLLETPIYYKREPSKFVTHFARVLLDLLRFEANG